jgi:hypothetical protein
MAPVLLVRPNGDFGTSRFKGNHILCDLTHLRNRWLRPETPIGIPSGDGDCGS